jgi:biopolymer transport protein ExbB/TolQ
MAPLLDLFGTVIGMIEIFGSQTATGSNPLQLAHGISVALYNTALGLIVAIPSMIFYRHSARRSTDCTSRWSNRRSSSSISRTAAQVTRVAGHGYEPADDARGATTPRSASFR